MANIFSNRLLLITIFGVGVIFIIDLLMPLGVAVGVLYILFFIPISREPAKRVLIFAIVVSGLVILKILIFYDYQTSWMVISNRIISVTVIWVAVLMSWQQRKLLDQSNEERDDYILKLESTNSRLSSIQQALDAHLLVSITNKKGDIIYANNNFCSISGYTETELMGMNHRILNSGYHDKDFFQNLWNTISRGECWSGEVKNKTRKGKFYWANTVIIPFLNEEREITQYLAVRIPITDKKLMEERQQEYVASLEKILNDISHKLRSPIATCLGLTQLIEYQKEGKSDLVDKAIEHRKTCAHDLINFSNEIAQYVYAKTKSRDSEIQ